MNYGRNYINHSSFEFVEVPKQQSNEFYINLFALSIPFRIENIPIVLGASYKGNNPYYYELGNSDVSDRFSAQMHMASLGLGLQPSSKLRIGLGWTHIIQKYQQISVEVPTVDCSSNESNYTTHMFYVGIQNDPSESLSLGLVFYFPAKLEAENESTMSYDRVQEYSASVQAGLGYHLNDNLTMGLGYGYQWLEAYESALSLLSAGIGYKFVWDEKSLPVYIMYETILFPQKFNERISDNGENTLAYHQVGLGAGIQFTDFSIYAASTWSLYGDYYYTSSLISPLPSFS